MNSAPKLTIVDEQVEMRDKGWTWKNDPKGFWVVNQKTGRTDNVYTNEDAANARVDQLNSGNRLDMSSRVNQTLALPILSLNRRMREARRAKRQARARA